MKELEGYNVEYIDKHYVEIDGEKKFTEHYTIEQLRPFKGKKIYIYKSELSNGLWYNTHHSAILDREVMTETYRCYIENRYEDSDGVWHVVKE